MRIIQVVGRSNSGKTSFIKKLVPELEKMGRVAVVKHLGDHEFGLEKKKDTTQFFEAGATISFGVDNKKSVGTFRINRLNDLLFLFSQQGIEYAVIEGFKTYGFPKIVIGDLVTENCVASNPTVQEVLASLERFDTYPKEENNRKTAEC
ncbi:MAG: molybdopterin-guanine dinucleotide biosynthesis protein B [Methanoregula sp.]|nr:MAG: molybdopterin-guanine dinucleotide biosynthesis protein B [Methanoregula sp.]